MEEFTIGRIASIKVKYANNPEILELIAHLEALRSRVSFLEGYKEGAELNRPSRSPELPSISTPTHPPIQNVPFFSQK